MAEILGLRRIRRRLLRRASGEVLEVAVGTGANLPYYPEGCRITAVDISEAMLEHARERARKLNRDVTFRRMDALHLDPVVTTISAELPDRFALAQNYPNPFNPTTRITFRLPERSDVRLVVYDVVGRVVATLARDQMEAGTYEVEWDGRDASGRVLPSGAYLYRIEAGSFTESRTMTLLK